MMTRRPDAHYDDMPQAVPWLAPRGRRDEWGRVLVR